MNYDFSPRYSPILPDLCILLSTLTQNTVILDVHAPCCEVERAKMVLFTLYHRFHYINLGKQKLNFQNL